MKYLLMLLVLSGTLLLAPGRAEGFPREKKLVQRLTPDEIREYYGLQYIIGDMKRMEYLSLGTPRERAQWLEKFWLGIDPTPTTDENEARSEHEQRVEMARTFFSMKGAPGWDGRGEILIRFGPPSSRMSVMGDVTSYGLTLPSEIWYYEALNMSVTFTDVSLRGRFTYAVPQKEARAPGPPERYGDNNAYTMRGGGPFTPPNPEYTADPWLRLMESIGAPFQLAALEGMKARKAEDNFSICMDQFAALYSCDTEWERLPLYVDVVSFRGGDWSDRTEVSFEIPAPDSALGRGRGKPGAEVDLSVLVRDKNLRKVASGKDRVTTAAAGLVPGQIVLSLEPGRYDVGIEARELGSNRRTAFKEEIDVPAYTTSPSLSGIQFATSIEESEKNERFLKGGLRVVPHPLREYRIPSPIVFYFEIYGLSTDKQGIAQYQVEYRIVPLEKKRWGPTLRDVPTNVSSMFEMSGYGSTQPQRLSIATNELWGGSFRLDVTVTDRTTDKTASQSATFSIVE